MMRVRRTVNLAVSEKNTVHTRLWVFLFLFFILIFENHAKSFTTTVSHHIWSPCFVLLLVSHRAGKAKWTVYNATITVFYVGAIVLLVCRILKRWTLKFMLYSVFSFWESPLALELISGVVWIDISSFTEGFPKYWTGIKSTILAYIIVVIVHIVVEAIETHRWCSLLLSSLECSNLIIICIQDISMVIVFHLLKWRRRRKIVVSRRSIIVFNEIHQDARESLWPWLVSFLLSHRHLSNRHAIEERLFR